jgi:ABC-type glycerol-3-phosphate transport system permease component
MKNNIPRYKKFTRSKVGNFIFFAILIIAGLYTVLPLIYSVITSFKPLDELLAFPPKFYVVRPTFKNYAILPELLSNLEVPFSRYVFNTVFLSAVITFLHVIIASMSAFVMCQVKNKWTLILFMTVQFALLYNATTLAVPQYLIFSKARIIDTYWVYILPMLPSAMGVFLIKQNMESAIPEALIEAARIDGASVPRIFWQIVMPLVKSAWMTLTLFIFRDSWSLQPSGKIFSESLKTLPNIMSQITSSGIARSGSAMAATVLLMIPPIVIYFATQSNVLETMSSAGIKE